MLLSVIALFLFAAGNFIQISLAGDLLGGGAEAGGGLPPHIQNLAPLPNDAPPIDALYPPQQDITLSQGYGVPPGGNERIDMPVVELPPTEETQEGQVQVFDHQLPDSVKENRFDLNKEIHSYSVQRKLVNINQRNIHRYFKNLNVNTLYNTNIQRIKHNKLQNVLVTTVQDKHEPTLVVKYNRVDTAQQLPDVQAPPIVENVQQNQVLPPVIEPARVEKLDYNGGQLLSQPQFVSGGPPIVAAMALAPEQAAGAQLQQQFPALFSNGDASADASAAAGSLLQQQQQDQQLQQLQEQQQQPLVRAVRENLQANKLAASKGQATFSLIMKKP